MPRNYFDQRIAKSYQAMWPELFEPAVVDPAVSFLADLAGTGAALELGIGTGRIAIPLSQRGVHVHGIDLSPDMVAQLRAKPGTDDIGVTIGDFAMARAGGTFKLAYLVRNTIMNLTTQDEQVACFHNVAAQLEPGGVLRDRGRGSAAAAAATGRDRAGVHLDLMARLAGMSLRERWSDWTRGPFTSDSTAHVSVWEKTA